MSAKETDQALKTAADIGALKQAAEQQEKSTSAIFNKLDDIQSYMHESIHKLRNDITPLLGMMSIIQRHGDELRQLVQMRVQIDALMTATSKHDGEIEKITESLTKLTIKLSIIVSIIVSAVNFLLPILLKKIAI